jgi:hypothetical protein
MNAAEIQEMTTAERLQAMELLWENLIRDDPKLDPPQWHGEVLRERIKRMESPKAKFYTLEQLKEHFKQ